MSEEKNGTSSIAEVIGVQNENSTANGTAVEKDAAVTNLPEAPPATPLKILAALINGAGVGLLLGMLLGLAISPVVSGVIGTLSGLLAVLLGINEKYISVLKGIRIGAFGFACVAGILWGMHIRVNHGLLPSRSQMMKDYTSIGFSETEARDFIAYREFGLAPAGWVDSSGNTPAENASTTNADTNGKKQVATSTGAKPSPRKLINPNEAAKAQSGLLYSSEVNADACQNLYATNIALPKSEVKNNFINAEGTWAEMAKEFDPLLPDDVYKQTLLAIRDCFCEGGMTGTVHVTRTTGKVDQSQSLPDIKKTFRASGGIWKKMDEKISNTIDEKYQKTVFLTAYQIFSHE